MSLSAGPVDRLADARAEQRDVEDIAAEFAFLGGQQVEQQTGKSLRDKSLGDISVARTEARGAAAMRENDKPMWLLRQEKRPLQSLGADCDVDRPEVARHLEPRSF